MRFISWNVNGIRASLRKGFKETFDQLDADIFALQETKVDEGQISLLFPGYHSYWSYAVKKGYSGTAVFSKEEPIQVLHGLGIPDLDTEGRICALEFPSFWLVDVYTPNAQPELARIDFRMTWDDAFRKFCVGLEHGEVPKGAKQADPKGVIMCGDFNVAHEEIDIKRPGPNRGHAGFSDQEREKFSELLSSGFTDTFRYLYPDKTEAYSWWSYRGQARKNNTGWRIDYFLVSESLDSKIKEATIFSEIHGSDHCPVGLELAAE